MAVANNLDCYDTATITAVKSFIVQAPQDTQCNNIQPNDTALWISFYMKFRIITLNIKIECRHAILYFIVTLNVVRRNVVWHGVVWRSVVPPKIILQINV
jgi:hypothetical protein